MTGVPIPQEIAARAAQFAGRSWLLAAIQQWAAAADRRFFVISGEPGCGKTALSAWLLGAGPEPAAAAAQAQLDEVRRLWRAAHFCVAGTGQLDPATFAESLARQLSQVPDFAEAIVQHNDPTIHLEQEIQANWGSVVGVHIEKFVIGTNPRDGYNRLVRQPLQLLAQRRPEMALFILVDALDEALAYGEPNIFTLLTESMDFPATVRFLITTRNVSQILKAFPATARLDLSAPVNARHASADVAAYVRQWQAGAVTPSGAPVALSAEMVEQIVDRAEGNFLYARFLLDEFVARGRPLDRLPAGVYGLYGQYLDGVVTGPRAAEVGATWLGDYQPLLGRLSVAVPAAPRALLPAWLDTDAGRVTRLLSEVNPLTEYEPAAVGGYRLYHRSMGEFLATEELGQDETTGEPTLNEYHTPPAVQHERIIRHYIDNYGADWTACDEYGLRQLATHLNLRLGLESTAAARSRWARQLYDLVRHDDFRRAQLETLGDAHAVLTDLRLAAATALQRDELAPALACIGLYRQTVTGQAPAGDRGAAAGRGLTAGIFAAVAAGDFSRAQRQASHYASGPKARGKWQDVLQLYLAWEAAAQGQPAVVEALLREAAWLPRVSSNELAAALLTHTARSLAATAGQGRDARAWLASLAPTLPSQEQERLLAAHQTAMAGAAPQVEAERLEYDLRHLLDQLGPGGDDVRALDEETAEYVQQMRHTLHSQAADARGQALIDQLLQLILPNAYPRYRDIGLYELGLACLAAPDPDWSRPRLQSILRVGLNVEGAIFTFDLPAILLAEADNPRRAQVGALPGLNQLAAFLDTAIQHDDRWGTAMRAQSARAAGLFWQNRREEAFAELVQASARTAGFAGYGSLAFLSLANRCLAFGDPQRAQQPIWGEPPGGELLQQAAALADRVNNWQFRQERLDLVQQFGAWWQEAVPAADGVPSPDAVLQTLGRMPEADYRRVYKDHVSARWLGAGEATAVAGLNALILAALNDGTTLDTLLGRRCGLQLARLTDEAFVELVNLCARHFTVARPWAEAGEEI